MKTNKVLFAFLIITLTACEGVDILSDLEKVENCTDRHEIHGGTCTCKKEFPMERGGKCYTIPEYKTIGASIEDCKTGTPAIFPSVQLECIKAFGSTPSSCNLLSDYSYYDECVRALAKTVNDCSWVKNNQEIKHKCIMRFANKESDCYLDDTQYSLECWHNFRQ
jgi:hypothetical protein